MKFALVTGSTSGIGKQIAIDLLKKGVFVILNYKDNDNIALKTHYELKRKFLRFFIIKKDLSTINRIDRFIKIVKNITKNKLDYLVLNTGITDKSNFKNITLKNWQKVFNTNVNIPFYLIQNLKSILRINGRIIFIGSILGLYPHGSSISYGVSKGCLPILSKYLVKEFMLKRVTINVISPGFVETRWHKNKSLVRIESIKNKIALKRFANVKEISKVCLSLINNSYINGQNIIIDGGYNYK